MRLLETAPDKMEVLNCYLARIEWGAWTNSRSAFLRERIALLDQIRTDTVPALRPIVAEQRLRLIALVERERHSETAHERRLAETFE